MSLIVDWWRPMNSHQLQHSLKVIESHGTHRWIPYTWHLYDEEILFKVYLELQEILLNISKIEVFSHGYLPSIREDETFPTQRMLEFCFCDVIHDRINEHEEMIPTLYAWGSIVFDTQK